MTSQITVRASEDLVERVKAASASSGRSMNDYVTSVLDAATDPSLAGSVAESIRDRLERAGLLAPQCVGVSHATVDPDRLAEARRRAGTGTSLSSLIADGR